MASCSWYLNTDALRESVASGEDEGNKRKERVMDEESDRNDAEKQIAKMVSPKRKKARIVQIASTPRLKKQAPESSKSNASVDSRKNATVEKISGLNGRMLKGNREVAEKIIAGSFVTRRRGVQNESAVLISSTKNRNDQEHDTNSSAVVENLPKSRPLVLKKTTKKNTKKDHVTQNTSQRSPENSSSMINISMPQDSRNDQSARLLCPKRKSNKLPKLLVRRLSSFTRKPSRQSTEKIERKPSKNSSQPNSENTSSQLEMPAGSSTGEAINNDKKFTKTMSFKRKGPAILNSSNKSKNEISDREQNTNGSAIAQSFQKTKPAVVKPTEKYVKKNDVTKKAHEREAENPSSVQNTDISQGNKSSQSAIQHNKGESTKIVTRSAEQKENNRKNRPASTQIIIHSKSDQSVSHEKTKATKVKIKFLVRRSSLFNRKSSKESTKKVDVKPSKKSSQPTNTSSQLKMPVPKTRKALTTKDMIIHAISELNQRIGSTIPAIKKFLINNFTVTERRLLMVNKLLKQSNEEGWLLQVSGHGASADSRFKLSEEMKKNIKLLAKKSNTRGKER